MHQNSHGQTQKMRRGDTEWAIDNLRVDQVRFRACMCACMSGNEKNTALVRMVVNRDATTGIKQICSCGACRRDMKTHVAAWLSPEAPPPRSRKRQSATNPLATVEPAAIPICANKTSVALVFAARQVGPARRARSIGALLASSARMPSVNAAALANFFTPLKGNRHSVTGGNGPGATPSRTPSRNFSTRPGPGAPPRG